MEIQGREITGILFFLTLLALSGCGGGGGSSNSISAVALTWEAPTTNSDGTPLTDLAGYKIYYRTSSGSYGTPINVSDENATNYTVDSLSSGTWCFAVTAYDTSLNESDYSNEVCTDI
ncbi:MAG: fibronectin type III domain-containing protein [Candidatus Mariimomonas ferrooxydans]